MRIKDLIIRNSVILAEESQEVVKLVWTPFPLFTRAWSRHEAACLAQLADLGYGAAPKLISASGNGFRMQKIDGRPLSGRPGIDGDTFRRLLDVVSRLHGLGFAHGNLRPRNILIADGGDVILIDFETCCRRGNPLYRLVRFTDWVRLHLLWRASVAPIIDGTPLGLFPRHVVLAMYIIAPLDRCARGMRALKRRARRSLNNHASAAHRRRVAMPEASEWRHHRGLAGEPDG
jgi:hypothetical protein